MTLLYGLLGEKLHHSISPKIHSIIHREFNIDASYTLFEISQSELPSIINTLHNRGTSGINVTIPYKIDIIKYIDEISMEARKIGSVNTIAFKDRIIGYNTDYFGFGYMLNKYHVEVTGKSAVILGAGGAARSVYHYLIDQGINDLFVAYRDPGKLSKYNNFDRARLIDFSQLNNMHNCDMVINCTPCGMFPDIDHSPVNIDILSRFSTAIDLIYNPSETIFLKLAKQLGLTGINGLYMLVAQAASAYKFWNELDIDTDMIDVIYENIRALSF